VLIDWFTVGAQAVNFLILVWLLKRYLYQPVLAAIDAREKKVAAKIADAAAQQAKAQVAGEELRKRNEAFDRDREGLMHKAADEASAERQRLSESARQDSELLRSKLTQALSAERAELGRQLALRTQAEVFALARQTLSDLAGANLEDRMIELFIARLASTDVDSDSTGPAPKAGPARVALVRSAFEPAVPGRVKVEAVIRERFGANAVVCFETAPELICGVELTVDGVKFAWSISDYLSNLAHDTAALAATELAVVPSAPKAAVPEEAVHAH
jgi:F-type H+-transporting ATPase subunit b